MRPRLFNHDHLGFKYRPFEDEERDALGRVEVIKIFHEIFDPDGRFIWGPWGSYSMPTKHEVERFIEELINEDIR